MPVTVVVQFFAGAAAAAGVARESVQLPGGATVATLIDQLSTAHGPGLARVLAVSSFLLDEVAGGPERALYDGAQVDVLPPFAGG